MTKKLEPPKPTVEMIAVDVIAYFGGRCTWMVRSRPDDERSRVYYAEIQTAYPNPVGAVGPTAAVALAAALQRCKDNGL